MSSVISLPSNITVWLGPALAVALAYLASAACREKVQICIYVTYIYSNIITYKDCMVRTSTDKIQQQLSMHYSHLYAIPGPT